jgi:hypothetical protein
MKKKNVFQINFKVDKKKTINTTIDHAVGSIKDAYKYILRNSEISGIKNKLYAMENNIFALMTEKQKKDYMLKKKLLVTFSKPQEYDEIVENLIVETYMSLNNLEVRKNNGSMSVILPLVLSKSKRLEKSSIKSFHRKTMSSFY